MYYRPARGVELTESDSNRFFMKNIPGYVLLAFLMTYCATQKPATQTADNSTGGKRLQLMADTLGMEQSGIINARAQYIDGLNAFEMGDYEKALDHLTAAYIKLPNRSGVNYALADTYLQLGDLVNAAYYGKQAASIEPGNKWYHLKLAEIYRQAGKNDATIHELRAALDIAPKDADVLYELARTYTDYNELLKANRIYDRIMRFKGPDAGIHLEKFRNFNKLGIQDSAIAELQAIRKLNPDNLSTLHTLSEFYMNNDRPNEAKSVLRSALNRNPRDPQTLVMLSDIYLQDAQYDSAGTLLSSVISDSLVPREGKMKIAQFLYSRFQQNQDNEQLKQQAAKLLQAFTRSEPGYGVAHALAADFYSTTGQKDRALEELSRTNEIVPDNEMAWRQRLQLLYSEGRYREVARVGAEADQNVPQDAFIQFFTGSAHLLMQQHQQAVSWLSKASEAPARKPFKSVIYGSLADAYSGLDNWEKASAAYEKALELDPENDNAMNNYAYYLSNRGERLDYARDIALKAVKLQPGNASYLDTAGWVFYKLGNYGKAREYIQKSIDTGEASAVVMEHLGNVYEKLGKPDQARKWWKKALEKDPSRKHLEKKIQQ